MKKCCKNTYLKNFQYKLLHRILPTNLFLYKIRQKDTSLCSFCNREEETLEHLFFNCKITYQFWLSFVEKIKLYDNDFTFRREDILLGFLSENCFINYLFVVAKNFIYRCKLNNSRPNILGLKSRLNEYQALDFYIANKNNTVGAHGRFWSPLQIIFNE